MKTLNALIISSLLALSVTTPVIATDQGSQSAEMNRILQARIDEKMAETLDLNTTERTRAMLPPAPAQPPLPVGMAGETTADSAS